MWSQARLMVEAHLNDELRCAQWCAEHGLIPHHSECRRHRRARQLRHHAGTHGVRWYCGRCDNGIQALTGTVFEAAHLPLGKAVMLAHCYAWGLSYDQAKLACLFSADDSVLSDRTIASWYERLRDRVIDYAADPIVGDCKIGGPGIIVQIDEALIGRRKYNRGRVIPGTWVIGMIDGAGELRLEVAPDRSAASLEAIISRNVEVGSEVHTDCWRGYNGLVRLGYDHKTVNHSVEFVSDEGAHTQRIESQWRNLRRRFSRGGIRHDDIGEHLIEHVWRRQCRRLSRDPFEDLLRILQC